jgi:hypothetical protein
MICLFVEYLGQEEDEAKDAEVLLLYVRSTNHRSLLTSSRRSECVPYELLVFSPGRRTHLDGMKLTLRR